MRPSEILVKYPYIKNKWTVNDIGQLLRMGLVSGIKLSRGCEVDEHDVIAHYDTIKKK